MENESYKEVEHTKAFASLGAKELDGVIKILTQAKDQAHERDLAQFNRIANKEDAEMQQASTGGINGS